MSEKTPFQHLVKNGKRMFSHSELKFTVKAQKVFVRNKLGAEVFEEDPGFKGKNFSIKLSLVSELPSEDEFKEFMEEQAANMSLAYTERFGIFEDSRVSPTAGERE